MDEVEAPSGNPFEISLKKWIIVVPPRGVYFRPFVRAVCEFLLKVEAAPPATRRGGSEILRKA